MYVALARGEATLEVMGGKVLRLADWFVRLKCGAPDRVVNETYSLMRFDAEGRVDQAHATRAAQATAAADRENAASPTIAEREWMRQLLFGGAPSADGG